MLIFNNNKMNVQTEDINIASYLKSGVELLLKEL